MYCMESVVVIDTRVDSWLTVCLTVYICFAVCKVG